MTRRNTRGEGEAGWLASLLGAVVLIVGGFALGLVAGVVTEEPELVVIHGARDRVVPLELGIELFMLAAEPKTLHVAPKSSHMTPWREERGEFEAMLVSFFTDALAR